MEKRKKSRGCSRSSAATSRKGASRPDDPRANETRLGAEIIGDLADLCESVKAGERVDAKYTVRTIRLNLKVREFDAEDVRQIRQSLNVSQALFAQILGASVECVESWEQGLRKPPPMACRLLELVSNNRDQWVETLDRTKNRGAATSTRG